MKKFAESCRESKIRRNTVVMQLYKKCLQTEKTLSSAGICSIKRLFQSPSSRISFWISRPAARASWSMPRMRAIFLP